MKRILTILKEKWPEYILEILVITIGILGAFGLNNWNENKNLATYKNEMLNSYRNELKANIDFLEDRINLLNQPIIDRLDSLIQTTTDLEKNQAENYILSVLMFPPSVPETPVLNELINSDLFKNQPDILNLSRELKMAVTQIQNSENFLNQNWINEISPFINQNNLNVISYSVHRNLPYSITDQQLSAINSFQFKNLAVNKFFLTSDWIKVQQSALNQMKEIFNLVEFELAK
jgi:hypothetical protein